MTVVPDQEHASLDNHEHLAQPYKEHAFHAHVEHDEHTDHITYDNTDQSDLVAELAHLFVLCALLIYGFTMIGCYIFNPTFVRQLAYILQAIRMFLTLAMILPCVIHWQAYAVFPRTLSKAFPILIVFLLVANLFVALGFRVLANYLLNYYQKYNPQCCILRQRTCKRRRWQWPTFLRPRGCNCKKERCCQ